MPLSAPLQWLRYALEVLFATPFFLLCRLLPLDAASGMGSWLGRTIGPHYKANRIAKRNLDLVFPTMPEAEKQEILRGMWDNLGRVFCEYMHLPSVKIGERIEVEGLEHIRTAQASGKPLLFISGHFGNWELMAKAGAVLGIPMAAAYRPANNPLFEKLLFSVRKRYYANLHAKGSDAARAFVRALKQGQALALLVDQKMVQGISVPFVGVPAMTSPFVADLAIKYDVAVIPCRIMRKNGAHFVARMHPAMEFTRTGNWDEDVQQAMVKVNDLLSGWVRDLPSQWFFVHNRWPRQQS